MCGRRGVWWPPRLLLGLAWAAIPAASWAGMLPVRVAAVERSTEAIPIEAVGWMERREEGNLAFTVAGIVERVPVRAGHAVKRGELLARLWPDEMDAQFAQAKSREAKAARDVARMEQLEMGSAVARQAVDDTRTALETARAEVRIAQYYRKHAEILAPADGVVLARAIEPGQWVAAGQSALSFGATEAGWRIRAQVPEADVGRLRVGDRVTFEGGGGRVTAISDAVDPATGTVAVEADCDGAPDAARSKRVVRVELHPRPVAERLVIPASALVAGTDGGFRAFFLAGESPEAQGRAVVVEGVRGSRAYLLGEFPPECAWIVTQGAEYLKPGMPVEPIR